MIKEKKNGLFRPLTPEDDSSLRKQAKEAALKTVNVDAKLAEADSKACEQIKKLLEQTNPNIKVEVISE